MTLLRPWALLLLPVLLLLLLLVRRWQMRRPAPATTYVLFARAQAKLPPPPRRRTWAWRELARLLPAALAVVALAGPVVERAAAPRPIVVVLDRSASMATRTGGHSRLDRAVDRVQREERGPLRFVGLPPLRPEAGPQDRQPSAATVSAEDLRRSAEDHLAAGERVVVASDQEIPGLPGEAGLAIAGDREPNRGLVACGLDDQARLLVRVAGAGDPGPAPFEVRVEDPKDDAGDGRTLPVPAPSGPGRWVFENVRPEGDQRIGVRLRAPDANPLDDAVVLVPESARPRVGFPLEGHRDLLRAFEAQPGLEVFRGDGPADLRVAAMNPDPHGWSLFVAPVDEGGFKTGVPGPRAGALAGRHGLFPNAADDLALPAVAGLDRAPPGTETLLSIGDAALLVRSGRTLVLLQVPEASDWPSRDSFPNLVTDLVTWIDLRTTPGWRAHRGGETVAVVRGGAQAAVLTDPSEARRRLEIGGDGRFLVPLEQPGVSVLAPEGGGSAASGWPVVLSCAVLSLEETAGAGAVEDSYRPPAPARRPPPESRTLEPWVLAAAGLAFLVLEGLSLARRRTS